MNPPLAALALCCVTVLLCGADGPVPAQPFALIIPIICVARRAHPIGGWLLFFHITNFTSLLASLAFLVAGTDAYRPSSWGSDVVLYVAFLFQALPSFALMIGTLIVAEVLRRTRNAEWLTPLRVILWIHFAHAAATIALDIFVFDFEISMIFDIIAVFTTFMWSMYFMKSKRVGMVYVTNTWPSPSS